ncbi:hypothetical protein OvHV-2gp16 [Ovine gammaherpesvirus 2]|uniref:Uncharacterized protein n=1 Tax=Ovine gammaherpesvirus 2 TaxID=10398 RepID=A1BM07_9GAMA|nr:hypothetical protein OvHV-2gp16 [Ovine gammaherpesvirus 2]WOZ69463.1 ORF18 hypothetical protein [Ovine gammaherpesvirus 2]
MSTNPATCSEASSDILGRYVRAAPSFSPGARTVLFKLLQGKSLNTLTPVELRYCHLVLTKIYELGLNAFLLREATANCGVTDTVILERKVPLEYWKILSDGLKATGVSDRMLLSEAGRGQLWLHLNRTPSLLRGLARYFFLTLGLTHHVRIYEHNLLDGNFLFNLGSVFPCCLLTVAAFCLVFWGRSEVEPWVRAFMLKIYLLYLVISGALRVDFSVFQESSLNGYRGILDTIYADVVAFSGPRNPQPQAKAWHPWLDYIFIFNNNIVLHDSHSDG